MRQSFGSANTPLSANAGRGGDFERSQYLPLTRIVSWIDIRNSERALIVYLHNGWTGCPSIVIHFRRGFAVPACRQFDTVFLIKLVAHSDVKIAGYGRHVFGCRMIVGGNLVTVRHLQAESPDRTVISAPFGNTCGAGLHLISPEFIGIFMSSAKAALAPANTKAKAINRRGIVPSLILKRDRRFQGKAI